MFFKKSNPEISSNRLFSKINFKDLNFSPSKKEFVNFEEGHPIYQVNDEAKFVYLILEGNVKIKTKDENEFVNIFNRTKNQFFGELEFLESSPTAKSSAVAMSNSTIYRIDYQTLQKLADSEEKLLENLKSPEEDFGEYIEELEQSQAENTEESPNAADNYKDEQLEAENISSEVEKNFENISDSELTNDSDEPMWVDEDTETGELKMEEETQNFSSESEVNEVEETDELESDELKIGKNAEDLASESEENEIEELQQRDELETEELKINEDAQDFSSESEDNELEEIQQMDETETEDLKLDEEEGDISIQADDSETEEIEHEPEFKSERKSELFPAEDSVSEEEISSGAFDEEKTFDSKTKESEDDLGYSLSAELETVTETAVSSKETGFQDNAIDNSRTYQSKGEPEMNVDLAKFLYNNIEHSHLIMGKYLNYINSKDISEDVKNVVTQISNEVQLNQQYMNSVLGLLDKRMPLDLESKSIVEILDDILPKLAEYSNENKVSIYKKLEDDGQVKIDEPKFYQACYQIIKNSCEASKGDGKIYVSTRRRNNHVEIEFEDNCLGIPESIQESVFEPYFSHGKESSGLGLTLAKKIVEDHGGEIQIKSALGEGTFVIISLPAE